MSNFDFDALLAQLAVARTSVEAGRLGRLLLEHVFGEKDTMIFAEHSDREIDTDNWNDEQRQVVVALAACDAAWPEIGFHVQESLELDFEPTQADLRAALSAANSPPREEDATPTTGEPTTEEVLEAVRRLVKVFTAGEAKTERELKRFERYRPHAAVAVPGLVETLENGKPKERQAVAWALGQIGAVARPLAAAALLKAIRDVRNESVPWALGQVGLDNYRPLLKLMKSANDEVADRADDAFSEAEDVPAEFIERLLASPDQNSRQIGVRKLRFKAASRNLPRLLELLDDPDKDVAVQARYGLSDAGPDCIPTLFEVAPAASPKKRRLLAEVLAGFEIDLSPHAVALAGWLEREDNAGVRKELLKALARVKTPSVEVIAVVGRLAAKKKKGKPAELMLRAMGQLRAPEFAPIVIARTDSVEPAIRSLALLTLRAFREPAEAVLACLEQALASDSVEVSLQAVWSLYHRGEEGVPILLARLNTAPSQRVKAEIAWALGLLGPGVARAGLTYLHGEPDALAASLAGWALENLEAEPCR